METPDVEKIAKDLLTKNAVFQKIFNEKLEYANIQPAESELAAAEFKRLYPAVLDGNYKIFHSLWYAQQVQGDFCSPEDLQSENFESACSQNIYDASKRKYLTPKVVQNGRRKKVEKFDLFGFISKKRASQSFHQLVFEDSEYTDDILKEVLLNNERENNLLDGIAEMASALNNCSTYKILNLHPVPSVK